jgi:hypothetical protein
MENDPVEEIILGFLDEVVKFGMLILAVVCIGLSLYGYVGG